MIATPKVGDIIYLKSTFEKGLILAKNYANNTMNYSSYENFVDGFSQQFTVYYILTSSAKIRGPVFANEFQLI
jgi:hypothetical protein